MKESKDKGIREILEEIRVNCPSECEPDCEHCKPLSDQAETEIKQSLLKEIEGKWPKDLKGSGNSSENQFSFGMVTGHNIASEKILKVVRGVLGGERCQ